LEGKGEQERERRGKGEKGEVGGEEGGSRKRGAEGGWERRGGGGGEGEMGRGRGEGWGDVKEAGKEKGRKGQKRGWGETKEEEEREDGRETCGGVGRGESTGAGSRGMEGEGK